ncbi:ATP-binding protein [Zhongshania sp. BJYM1]|jgi:MoxR-like ATPase|uniref:ATP-binding protein n=1 Tax=Zhongshania aquatica TaxID=2965069 RepID=UPI0022B4F45D|nr:AAA family ATPase [Marortus sp. BJYM1]
MVNKAIQRLAAEDAYSEELAKLREWDTAPVPPGWVLSPFAVEHFILGNEELGVERKFVASRELISRVIISLATNRGVMLIGEPGTAKSWLSELLACAVSGHSKLTIQGGAVSHYSQLLYDWNKALLQRDGPTKEALIPGPVYRGMAAGQLVRFEELARCPQMVQDAILSVLSERQIQIPELSGEDATLYARDGFNIIASSNSLDRGLFDMSAALKRRMNFETIEAINDVNDEMDVVQREATKLLRRSGVTIALDPMIVEMLVTVFHELRNGVTLSGRSTDRLAAAVMSTAEAVSVAHALGVYAHYYREGRMEAADLIHFLLGATLKDNLQDRRRVKHYFDTEVVNKQGSHWQQLYAQSHMLKV